VENPGKFECFGQASASTRSACAKQRDESEHFLLLLRVCVCVCCLTRSKDFLWRFGVLCRELDHLRTG
jgi:hypothetical protein